MFINQPEADYLPRFKNIAWLPSTPKLVPWVPPEPTDAERELLAIARQLRDTPDVMLDAIDSLLSYYELNSENH